MPYGRKRRRSFGTKKGLAFRKRRRLYRAKRKAIRRGKPSKISIKQPSGLPDRLFVKLRYNQTALFSDAVGGVPKYYIYSGNSVYDPDITGTGHQPYLYDQWTTLYSAYRCHGSKIRVNVWNNATGSTNSQVMCTVAALPQTTVLSTADEYREMPHTRRCYTSLYRPHTATKWFYMTPQKVYGITKYNALGDHNWQAGIASSPSSQFSWQVYLQPVDMASTWACYVMVDIIYYVEFFHRKYPGVS